MTPVPSQDGDSGDESTDHGNTTASDGETSGALNTGDESGR